MTSLSALSSAIANIYDAVAAPEDWPHALDGMGALCGAAGVALFPVAGDVSRPLAALGYMSRDVAEAGAAYLADWAEDAPGMVELRRRPIFGRATWDGELVDPGSVECHAFYNDFAHPFGLRHGSIRIMPNGFMMLAPYSRRTGVPSEMQFELFELLSAHVERALSLGKALAMGGLLFRGVGDMLEHNGAGVVLLDDAGRVVELNDRALELMGDGLFIDGGMLKAQLMQQQAALTNALRCDSAGVEPRASVIRIDRPAAGLPLLAGILPLSAGGTGLSSLFSSCRGFLVTVIDPHARPLSLGALALVELGLSPAEARIAIELSAGHAPEAVARCTGLSVNTVRNHLKSIFHKLGVARQSELVSMLAALRDLPEVDIPRRRSDGLEGAGRMMRPMPMQ